VNIATAIGLFFICWWLALFALLPFKMGAKPAPLGEDPFAEAVGAPSSPKLKLKFVLATIIAAVIAGGLYAAFAFDLISIGEAPAPGRSNHGE
jgi:predicted secreted protein